MIYVVTQAQIIVLLQPFLDTQLQTQLFDLTPSCTDAVFPINE